MPSPTYVPVIRTGIEGATTTTDALTIKVAGDTGDRFVINADGTIEWGPGNAPADVNLYRSAVNVLTTDDKLLVIRSATTDTGAGVRVVGDAVDRFHALAGGTLEWGSGAGAVDTLLRRSGAAALETTGFFAMGSGQSGGNFSVFGTQLIIGSAGGGLLVKEGANATAGTATLVGGAATVATTKVTATSRIQVTSNADGGTPGFLRVSTRVAGTSFTITSSSGTDTSSVAWFLVEPAP